MTSELTKIEVSQTAKTLAIVVAILTSMLSALFLIALALGTEVRVSFNYIFSIMVSTLNGKVILLLVYPLLSFVMTYLTVSVLCLIYNVTAKYTGGIKIRLASLQDST